MHDKGRFGTLLATVLAACATPFATPAVAHAGAGAAPGGSASYDCKSEGDATTAATPVTFALIDRPSSTRPGDAVPMKGALRITLSDAEADKSKLTLARKAKIDATSFNLVAEVGGKELNLEPTSVTSTLTTVKAPFTLSARVSYPDLIIPSSATGPVIIRMPTTEKAPTPAPEASAVPEIPETPEAPEASEASRASAVPVGETFTARLRQDSSIVPDRTISCSADTPAREATVARIPVATPAEGGTAPPAGTDDHGTTPEGLAPESGAGLPVDAPAAGEAPPPEVPSAASTASASGASTEAAGTELSSAPIPPRTVSDETFVPGWMLALFISVFPVAAISYAVRLRRRLHGLQAMTTSP